MTDYSEISYMMKLINISLGIPNRIIKDLGAYSDTLFETTGELSDTEQTSHIAGDFVLKSIFSATRRHARYQTMDRIISAIGTSYIILYLSDDSNSALIAGPYITMEVSDSMVCVALKALNFPKEKFKSVKNYLNQLPLAKEDTLLSIFYVARLHIFKDNLANDLDLVRSFDFRGEKSECHGNTSLPNEMQNAEWRAQIRKCLWTEIGKGLFRSSNEYLSQMLNTQIDISANYSWTVQAKKLNCASLNALFREAATQASKIHPILTEKVYYRWLRKLEITDSAQELDHFPCEMLQEYCVEVRRHQKSYSPLVGKVCSYIAINLRQPMNLQEISDAVGKSVNYLSKIFKTEVGLSIVAYIHQERMKNAQMLLQTSNMSVQDIADQVGISDAGFFTRLFKKQTGITPSEYRKNII